MAAGSAQPKLVLYSYWRSSSAYRVRLALAVKGLDYELVAVNLLQGEQQTEAHRARHPLGYVPCLYVDGEPVVESVAIIELLEELFPNPRLYPTAPLERARVRALVETINADTQPLQNLNVLDHLSRDPEARKAWASHFIGRGLRAFETLLTQPIGSRVVPGPFCAGESISAADLYLVPQVYNARRFGIDLGPFPRILAAEQYVLAIQAVKRAIPENQPDAVP